MVTSVISISLYHIMTIILKQLVPVPLSKIVWRRRERPRRKWRSWRSKGEVGPKKSYLIFNLVRNVALVVVQLAKTSSVSPRSNIFTNTHFSLYSLSKGVTATLVATCHSLNPSISTRFRLLVCTPPHLRRGHGRYSCLWSL